MLIVSRDRLFAEALQITLRTACIAADIAECLPDPLPSGGLIVDLDALADTPPLLPAQAITFSRRADSGARFVRPFRLTDLASALSAAKEALPPVRESDVPPPFLRLTPDGVLLQGKPIPLSPAEHTLLALLLESPNVCVPTQVIDGLWQEKGGNTTAVYIRYLRKKLDEPTGLRLIRTVRGRGYCLCLPA